MFPQQAGPKKSEKEELRWNVLQSEMQTFNYQSFSTLNPNIATSKGQSDFHFILVILKSDLGRS